VPAAGVDVAAARGWAALLDVLLLWRGLLLLLLLDQGAWVAQAQHILDPTGQVVAAVPAGACCGLNTGPLRCCIVHVVPRCDTARGTLGTLLAQLCVVKKDRRGVQLMSNSQ
jgi:hypothetical protein